MRALRVAAATAAALTTLVTTAAPGLAAPPAVPADGADLIAVTDDGGGGLSLRFRDAAGTVRDPAGLRLGPDGGLATTVPDDPAYAFLGAPGRAVWSLSAGGSRFPAIDTTGAPGPLSLRLDSVDGPGGFAAYTVSGWGRPAVLVDSDGPATAALPAGARLTNVAWTFDTPGVYRLGFTVSGEPAAGSASAVYTVEVPEIVPAEPGTATAAPGGQVRAQVLPPVQPQVRVQPRAAPQAPAQAPAAQARTAATPAVTTAAPTAGRVISDGHVDMGPTLENGAWRIRLKDDAANPPAWLELSDVVLRVTDKAKIPVPAGTGYAFLGREGAQVHLLPQTQQAGIVWPGWNTQHSTVTSGVTGDVTWTLKGVEGPGTFALFLTGSFGTPQVLFDSAKPMPQKLAVPLNTHAHGNWAFTAPGLYRLAVEMSATTKAGAAVSDTRTLTIAVGDATDPGAGNTGGGGTSAPAPSGGGLPLTGANVLLIAAVGAILVVAGAGAVLIGRRRTVTQDTLPRS